ncbi:hypothetical protein JW868_03075 [Candidatus Woesearchaeota archaeon]|nr:hypothetical protein [Candidatus Woesearchaeota archaeon]
MFFGLVGFILTVYMQDKLSEDAQVLFTIFFIFMFIEGFMNHTKNSELKKEDEQNSLTYSVAPLNNTFTVTVILGFLISIFWIAPQWSEAWGAAFAIVFLMMFIASMISMTRAPVGWNRAHQVHLDELAVHHKIHGRRKH